MKLSELIHEIKDINVQCTMYLQFVNFLTLAALPKIMLVRLGAYLSAHKAFVS